METNTLTQEEFDYIKNIDTHNYLIDNIDIENDPIYKKLSELDIINKPEEVKEFIENLVYNFATDNFDNPEDNKIEFYKLIFYIHTNFIKILEEKNKVDNLIEISTNCGLFDFGENQNYQDLSFQNITYTLGKNYNEFQEDLSKEILNKLIEQNEKNICNIVDGFVQGCLSQSKNISEIQNTIVELVKQNKQNPNNIVYIINSFVQGCLSQNKDIEYTKDIFFELIEKRKKDSFLYINNLSEIINGFVQGCLFQDKNISEIRNIIFKLIESLDNSELDNIVSGLVQGYLTHNEDISEIKDVLFKIIKLNPYNNSYYVAKGFIEGCLKQNNITDKIQDVIFELAKQYPYRIINISEMLMNGYFLQNKLTLEIQNTIFKLLKQNPIYIEEIACCIIDECLLNNKSILDIQNFIIEANKQENIEIDIIYSIIKMCCLDNKVQIGSENFKQLIQVINNLQNQKKEESQKILCGMYISNHLFKVHQNNIDKNNIKAPQEFLDVLNEVLQRQENNRITKIEDLTVKEIKTLFDGFMDIKFNQTKKGVNSNILETGPFLQIITSLAENSGVGEDITIEELFNKQKETIKKTEEKSDEQLTKIETFQKKLNNFIYVEIKKNTDINSTEDFIEILGLKPEYFGKLGFKTFYVGFPGHAVTMVIDTSKSYDEFIKNNRYILKNIVIIDSSQALNWNINNGRLKFSNPNTEDFIKKIPVPNFNYQENGTCWGNTTCANSALLNNYKNFDEIVEKNEKGEIIGLKEGVQENIINETSKYYVSNTEIETNKSKYYDVKQTNIVAAEFRGGINASVVYNDKQATYNDEYTIKSNVKQEQLFQTPLEVFKAQQFELKNKKLTEEEKNLKQEKEDIEKQLEEQEISIEEFNKKYEEYKQKKLEFKKLEKRLDLIIDKKLDYVPTFEKEKPIENFRCYSNSKHANDTILSFDMYMGNKDKKVSIKFVLKDTDIKTVNKEFIQQLEEKIKTNGLESYLRENCEIKVKIEGLENYVNLRESYHKNRICGMVRSHVGLRMK